MAEKVSSELCGWVVCFFFFFGRWMLVGRFGFLDFFSWVVGLFGAANPFATNYRVG